MSAYAFAEPKDSNTVHLFDSPKSTEPATTVSVKELCFEHPELAVELFEEFEFVFAEEEVAVLEELYFSGVTLELPVTRKKVDASRDPNDVRTIYKSFVKKTGKLCYEGKPFGPTKSVSKRYVDHIQDKINESMRRR